MRRLRLWPVYSILTVLAVLPAAGCSFDDARASEEFHTSAAKAPSTIEVHNAVGAIEIDAWNNPNVQIDAQKRGSTPEEAHAITISVEPNGSALVITSHFPANSSNCKVDYIIHAPAGTNIDLNQSIGAIKSAGFTGNVDEKTSTGAIAATMGALGHSQHVNLEVSVGAIALRIPAASSAAFTASTTVGPIKADFPLSITRKVVGADANGSIGSGEAKVDLTAMTGAIAIQRE
jgi:uncharacterized protein YaiE (UPF0345 family)